MDGGLLALLAVTVGVNVGAQWQHRALTGGRKTKSNILLTGKEGKESLGDKRERDIIQSTGISPGHV